ncbi:MAG TPA: type 4a pilus biogenesis protein PilO [Candidatus Binatia bacterium]|jgi:type IV pilus assembly protein PilO
MKDLLERLFSLPRQQKLGILAGVIVLLLILDYMVVYDRFSGQIAELEQSVGIARNDRDKKQALVADLPKLRVMKVEYEGRLKEAVAELPDQKEIPDLLTNISNKARESGLDILLFRPKPENPQDFYAEIPVDVTVRGGFHNLVAFFDQVGRLNRLVNINNIDMKNTKPSNDDAIVDTTALVTTFRFLSEAERAKIAADKAAKEKAKK